MPWGYPPHVRHAAGEPRARIAESRVTSMSAAESSRKRSARDRLLETADRLFYDEGIHNVGNDRVLEQSGVAKGSLYYNFSGKDDLVLTYLHNRHAKWASRIDEELEAASDPDDKILAIFDALADLFAQPDFRG